MQFATILLIILYPLTIHFSVAIGDPNPALFMLLAAVLLLCLGLLRNRHYAASAYTLFGAFGIYFVVSFLFGERFTILYIPPLVVSLFLVWLFGHTLAPGRAALISQMAQSYHGELPPRLAQYTRRLTQIWTGYFALFAFSTFYLVFFNSAAGWSFYINLVNYVIIAMLLVGEYILRLFLFKDLQHPSFIDYIRLIKDARLYLPFPSR